MTNKIQFFLATAAIALMLISCGETKTDGAVQSKALTAFDACSCATVSDNTSEDYKKCKQLRDADPKFETDFQQCALAHKSGLDTNQVKFNTDPNSPNIRTTENGTYSFDASTSKITWRGEKVTGKKHSGTINVKSGSFTMENGNIASGEIVIDMNSIKVVGEEAGSSAKLETHLKSDDFFGAGKFSDASFKVKSSTQKSKQNYEVDGTLTIKGISKDAKAVMTIAPNAGNAVLGGSLVFDRSQFDVRYGSDKFFDNLGNDMIKNEIILTFDLQAKK
ncbi:MAG: YceI family protein [Flavobacteriales bacterium]